jgi:hypothetical protein
MTHFNQERRRNRTLSVERLESRQLLTRTITGALHGSLTGFAHGTGGSLLANFEATGKLENFGGPHKKDQSELIGEVRYIPKTSGEIMFTAEKLAVLEDKQAPADQIYFDYSGTGKFTSKSKSEATFTWNGMITGGAGVFGMVAPGTFHAHGTLFGGTKNEIKITKLTVHIT